MKLIHPTNLTNFSALQIGDVEVHFSYQTPIGLVTPFISYVAENIWGSTTGGHINFIKRSYPGTEEIEHSRLMNYIKEEMRNAYD